MPDDKTERWRCEVRYTLRLCAERGAKHLEDYLALVGKQRGKESADRLRAAAREQWGRGNRGAIGIWRD